MCYSDLLFSFPRKGLGSGTLCDYTHTHLLSSPMYVLSLSLSFTDPSNPPTNLTVLSDSDCSVNMSWAPPQTDTDTAGADTIVIEYSQAGRTWSKVARVPVRNTTATVRLPGGGEADASYQLRARSHSDQFGDGRTSNPTAHFSLYPGSMLHQL